MRGPARDASERGRAAAASEVVEAVLGARGRVPAARRLEALAHAWAAAGGDERSPDELGAAAAIVDKVARHAYRVTDEDIAEARRAGLGDDELFELIVAAAVGAGMARRSVGLAAVASWEEQR